MEKKKKRLKIALIILLCLLVAGFSALGYYLYKQANSGLFFEDTKINGYDVAGMTSKQVLLMLEKNYSAPALQLMEDGEEALTLTLEDMGYTINEMELLSNVKECMTAQTARLLFSLMGGNEFEITVPFDFDETVFEAAVSSANLAKPRVASVDATLEFKDDTYYIEPEVYGNEMDDADLQVMVKDSADQMVSSDRPMADIVMDIPESFYFLPKVYEDDSELNTLMNIYNSFCRAKITYTFGGVTEELDWSTIQTWLDIQDGEATLLEEGVRSYVNDLANRYDTLYYQRDFVTTGGSTIHFDSSDYGYQIDRDGEVEQLVQDIYNNTEVTRDPVYAQKGYTRNGRDDICGNYVEVNLTQQHLWFYKGGELIIETDIVSGLPTEERETITGVFVIPYKKSPETLKGDTWEEEVTYWMPFYDGQGLHDAPWRSSFGGSIYLTNGSHGCVNLPYAAAETIYENMEERYAIFLYK